MGGRNGIVEGRLCVVGRGGAGRSSRGVSSTCTEPEHAQQEFGGVHVLTRRSLLRMPSSSPTLPSALSSPANYHHPALSVRFESGPLMSPLLPPLALEIDCHYPSFQIQTTLSIFINRHDAKPWVNMSERSVIHNTVGTPS